MARRKTRRGASGDAAGDAGTGATATGVPADTAPTEPASDTPGVAWVTVVGLGPAGPDLMSPAAHAALTSYATVFLRTNRHPAAAVLTGIATFDDYYDSASTFEEVYERIVEDLVQAALRPENHHHVVYGVPGSPFVAERTVELLRADGRVRVQVVPGLSFLDLAWDRLGVDPVAVGVRLVDGSRFAEQAAGGTGPMLVAQCWSTGVLSEIKLSVDGAGTTGFVTVLHHLGLPDERVEKVVWEDLDRSLTPDHLTSVWIPELAPAVGGELVALGELVRRLRSDCPWDREQTHASLTRHLLEEAYEVIDAIDALTDAEAAVEAAPDSDPAAEVERTAVDHLQEELGDLLVQVYFHSCLAAEEGRFTLADVARDVREKLVARHPHVFGDAAAHDAQTVLANWEEQKLTEKGRDSVTDGIPLALPALALSSKLQRKATSVPGLTLPEFAQEKEWLVAALAQLPVPGSGDTSDAGEDVSQRVGALLFGISDLGRLCGVEPEEALRAAALRFRDHVRDAEQRHRAQGNSPVVMSSPAMVGRSVDERDA
jgi:tetrapyrrole methylase family protein / MazG family protein